MINKAEQDEVEHEEWQAKRKEKAEAVAMMRALMTEMAELRNIMRR